jgi:tRNA-specific 2-thiouridylase
MKRVLVGLSGGVDSAAVALILKREGYEVFGAYLSLCPNSDPEPAREVAKKLGIPFVVANYKKSFENRVVKPFLAAYREGKTPNPCVECNRFVKIAALIRTADRLGIEMVATGHYATIVRLENGRYALARGKDGGKDQSYFLWRLNQKQLSRLMFPLSSEKKSAVKEMALALIPPKQKESMEICFIPDSDTQGFLEKQGAGMPAGDFVDREGKVLGAHGGIHRYTIGQRRGLGVAMGSRYFVTELLPEENKIVLGPEEDLMTNSVFVKDLHFVSCHPSEFENGEVFFQGRNRAKPTLCRVEKKKNGVLVRFAERQRKIAFGQSACFYRDDLLLCGGVIAKEF